MFSALAQPLEAGLSETPAPKLFVWSWTGPENFTNIHSFKKGF
jgi:hypothetical protein